MDMANQQYINEMTVEFEKCQAMEKIRIEFFVETLRDYLGYVDVSKDARLVSLSIEFSKNNFLCLFFAKSP